MQLPEFGIFLSITGGLIDGCFYQEEIFRGVGRCGFLFASLPVNG